MKVLKSMNKRILAIFLALAMVVTGLYVFVPEAENVQAADTESLFAGYYEDAEKTIPVEVETPYEKTIDAGVLSIKLQMKKNTDGSYDMCVISSVDSLNYKNVGFEVYYNDATEPIVFETTAVLERISATAGVTYEYSPKVINTASEYFVTGTIKGIAAKNLDVNFYIKPFLTTLDGTLVYGQSRYFTVNDGVSDQNINIPVKMDASPGASVSVSVGGTAAAAEVAAYKDGYAHLNIPVDNKTTLKSATTITVGEEKVVYRNLLSTGSADTSWYDEYKNDTNEFVIANKADLLGFVELAKTNNFADKTVNLISDVTLNDAKAINWETGALNEGYEDYSIQSWLPIGRKAATTAGADFAGKFNGGNNSISGLYCYYTAEAPVGLFAKLAGGTVCNVKVVNSYFESTVSGGWIGIGSIAGIGYGNIDSVYSDANVICYGEKVSGILGWANGGKATITNTCYAGTMTMKGTLAKWGGGIIGYVNSGASFELENCLSSGILKSECSIKLLMLGGLVGANQGSASTIKSSLCTASISAHESNDKTYVGSILAWIPGGAVTTTDTYGMRESFQYEGNTGYTGSAYGTQETYLKSKSELTGQDGYLNTKLDFYRNDTKDGEWGVTETGTPVLRSFAEDTISLDGVLRAADTSWFDNSKSEFVIDEPEELLGLVALMTDTTAVGFPNKTIKLGADISINDLAAVDWKTGEVNAGYSAEDLHNWTPIGRFRGDVWHYAFKGMFDGQGHTISGLYLKTSYQYSGLFGQVDNGTVKNLRVENSYFEYTGTGAGYLSSVVSILGTDGTGLVENVYSNATVVSSGLYTGGIVGSITDNYAAAIDTFATINGCWYDGKLAVKGENGKYAGGILGGIDGYNNGTYVVSTISNCLNTGTITAESTNVHTCVGGIAGYIYYDNLAIQNTVNTGSVTTTGNTTTVGSISGWANGGSATGTASKVYATTESCSSGVGLGTYGSVVNQLPQSDLMYAYGYINTDLDFYDYETKTGYWTAVADGTIALKSFAENKISTKDAIRSGDQSWYDGSGSYTISTPEQLVGFMELAKTNDFSGATITLGADIKMNDGDASTWGTKAPKNVWAPIGKTAAHGIYKTFAGTFDGDGHTISGLYVKTSSDYVGLFGNAPSLTVKNLQLTNSYFEHTNPNTASTEMWGCVGSILGIGAGTFESVYSDAIVISGASFVGGFVGRTTADTTMRNCWFDGEVLMTGYGMKGGGLIGGNGAGTCTLTNCLNSGTVFSETPIDSANVGGFVGYVSSRKANLTNCLNVGNVDSNGAKASTGAILGYETGSSSMTNVYSLEGSSSSVGTMTNASSVGILPLSSLTGDAALTSLSGFDFYSDSNTTGIWKTVDGGTPILAVFGK